MSEKKTSFLWNGIRRQIMLFLAVVVLIGLAIAAVLFGVRQITSSQSDTKELGFENIGELATQVAYCTEVSHTEGDHSIFGVSIPFTKSTSIFSYEVVIKAGIDFTKVEYELNEDQTRVKIVMPKVKILSSELDLDSFKMYYEKESVFKPITMNDTNEALMALRKNAEDNAIANGLLENAKGNAEVILKGFFRNAYPKNELEFTFVYR